MTLSSFPLYFNGKCNRVVLLAVIAAVFAALGAAPAQAHPLGNFSVNHLSTVSISSDRVEVRYVLDQAEIPTVQERGLGRAEVLRRKLQEVRRGLILTVNGQRTALGQASAPRLSFPTGAGGLNTTRLKLILDAAVRNARRVESRTTRSAAESAGRQSSPQPAAEPPSGPPTPSGDPRSTRHVEHRTGRD